MDENEKRNVIETLREQVRRIAEGGTPGAENLSTDLDSLFPGEFVSTSSGPVFVARKDYAAGAIYGRSRFSDFLGASGEELAYISGEKALAAFRPEGALFLDIETSNPRDNAGALAFMAGLGFFEGHAFCVRQIFLRSPAEEAASLNLLANYLTKYSFLVTFNGKDFDVPFLAERMYQNRVEPVIASMPHLDLLPPSRKIFRKAFENCRLVTLEREVVGILRRNDIPSFLIPNQYDDYRADLDPRKMRTTFEHNLHDVASMAPLAARLARSPFLADPEIAGLHPREALLIGKLHISKKRPELAPPFLEAALSRIISDPSIPGDAEKRSELRRELSLLLKKADRAESAAILWREMIGQSAADFDILPYMELSKHHERDLKDLEEALRLTRLALERCPVEHWSVRQELHQRVERLAKKISAAKK